MPRDRKERRSRGTVRHLLWLVRGLALVLVLAMLATATVSLPACDTVGSETGAAELDAGPTFGVELRVTIRGRGRVYTRPAAIDCPGTCFARVLLEDGGVDGAPERLALVAEATGGARFDGWSFEAVEVGIRARGPAECSPMMRTSLLPEVAALATQISLPYAETTAVPPAGLETACAAFTAAPAAYVVTATFEDRFVDGGRDAGSDAGDVLFTSPVPGPVVGKEIGLAGGNLYWRFERDGLSGVAGGRADGQGPSLIVAPTQALTGFHVDRNVVFQTESGLLEAVRGGEMARIGISAAPPCTALASDTTSVYCRMAAGPSSSSLFRWPLAIGGTAGTLVHTLPRGDDLAVDEQRVYFSEPRELDGGGGSIQSASRTGTGAPAPVVQLVMNQTAPRGLTLGPSHLFWLDERVSSLFAASAAPKLGGPAQTGVVSSTLRFVAADPSSSAYYLGITGSAPGSGSIVRATASAVGVTPLRSNLTGLGGLAVGPTYVYWTQSDGRVYRARK